MTLIRRTPLKRGKLRPMSKRRKDRLAAWAKVTLARMVRVGNRCERCGASGVRLDGHHKKLRSQGGEDVEANCIVLCARCHDWAHRNPQAACEADLMEQHGGRE